MSDNAGQVLILRDELQTLWQGKNVFVEVQQLCGQVVREAPGRQTLRFQLAGQTYYRKLHTGVGWGEIFKNLIRLRLPVLGARTEWDAFELLHRIGVPTLEAVGYGEKKGNPARRESFLITRELADTVEMDSFLFDYFATHSKLAFSARARLIQCLADVARKIHGAGLNHRDFYLCHFLLVRQSIDAWLKGDAMPQVFIVDLHRAQIRSKVPFRWQVKDLASIYFSAMDLPITRGDQLRFLSIYFGLSAREVVNSYKPLLRAVDRRAQQLYKREARLRARGER
jgi:hypothetical protein